MANEIDAPTSNDPAHPKRFLFGVVQPEGGGSREDEDEGIEIDNAIERPQEGQPGQPGAKFG